VFEITVDGRLAFSKKAIGRFPEDAEIDALGA
jgi:predicted Rdx family selenoprotein